MERLVPLLLSAVLAAPLSAQITWNVPGDSATIQGAVDLASGGDTVLVAPGTYVETVDLTGKAITLEGTGGSAATIIDAAGAGTTLTLDRDVVVRGFTLTGGQADDGGGLRAVATSLPTWSATVEGCRITGNTASDSGGGAYVWSSLGNAAVSFSRCVFDGNESSLDGGGIALAGQGTSFADCTFRGNQAGGDGGGLFAYFSAPGMTGCRFEHNVAGGSGAGAWIRATETVLIVSTCTFRGNEAGSDGGGLAALTATTAHLGQVQLRVEDCVFLDNAADGDGGGLFGEAVNIDGPFGGAVIVERCVAARNTAGGNGGGVAAGTVGLDLVSRGTFVDNGATGAGTAIAGVPSVTHSILWGNAADGASFTYSDVEGGASGTGNIDDDPLFVDASADAFCLTSGSPCIDAGNPALTDPDGSRRDMGAIPRDGWCDAGRNLGSTNGIPVLSGDGPLTVGSTTTVTLTDGPPLGSGGLIIGFSQVMLPFKGGTLVPGLDVLVLGLPLDAGGDIVMAGPWPTGVPAGFTASMQMWMQDPGGVVGFTSSNGLLVNTP